MIPKMNLIQISTGRKIRAKIERLTPSELKGLKNDPRFGFDWSLEVKKEVYGIQLIENDRVLGLVSLLDIPSEIRIHIDLIESSKENQGKNKEYNHISGCLIGFVCQKSFEKGYGGFVSLTPKTQLINHYHKKFGFIQIGVQMAVFMEKSQLIINKYLHNEEV